MRIRDEDGLADPEFSMAPLIDIVFQLLIFFLVATTYTKTEQTLDVELPRAESSSVQEAPKEIVVDVLRDGRTFVAGTEVERTGLVTALREAAGSSLDVPVTVRGDRLVAHESVVCVLDACKLVGLSNIGIGALSSAQAR